MVAAKKYPDELRVRAVRLYRDAEHPKPRIAYLAEQLGVHPEALRKWIRQDEADRGERGEAPVTGAEAEELRRLRKEVTELRRANEILRAAS